MLLVVLSVAAGLRFDALGSKSLWLDEALSWRLSGFPLGMMIRRTSEPATVHPPLYFATLRLWRRIGGESEWALRSLSALLGVLTVLGMFVLSRQLASLAAAKLDHAARLAAMRVGVLASLLTALSAFHVSLSKQVRGYTLATLLFVSSSAVLLMAIRAARARSARWLWGAYVVLAVAFCYSHNLATLSVAAQVVFLGLYLWAPGAAARVSAAAEARAIPLTGSGASSGPPPPAVPTLGLQRRWAVVAVALVAVGYLPWLPSLWGQSQGVRSSWSRPLAAHDCAVQPYRALLKTPFSPRAESLLASWGVTVLLAGVLVCVAARGGWSGAFLLIAGVLPVCLNLGYSMFSARSVFDARYLAFAQLAWLASFAMGVSWIPYALERSLVAAPLVLWAAYSSYDNWDLLGPAHQPGIRGAVAHVLAQRGDDERVVAQTPFVFFQMLYYMRAAGAPPLLCVSELDRHQQRGAAHLLDSDLVTPGQILDPRHRGLWLVTTASYHAAAQTEVPAPERWTMISETSFEQDYHWEGPVTVRHYRDLR